MDLGPTSLSWLNTVPFGQTNEYLQFSMSTQVGLLFFKKQKQRRAQVHKRILAESPTRLLNAHVVHLAERLLVRVEP